MTDQTQSNQALSSAINDVIFQNTVSKFQSPRGYKIMKNIFLAAIPVLSLFSIPSTLQANEQYVGKSLPPDEILSKNAGTVYGGRGPIVGKIASDTCHQVFFLDLKGGAPQKLHVTVFCRLDNNLWIYSPTSGGGHGLVIK